MIRAAVSSGRASCAISAPTKCASFVGVGRGDGFDRRGIAAGLGLRESRAAHGDDLDRVARLHFGDRVTGIDRALERVGRNDGGNIRDLRHIEQRRDARQEVLAEGRRRGQHMAVILGETEDERGVVFRGCVFQRRRIGEQHFGDAGQLRGFVGDRAAIGADDQQVDVAADRGCGADDMAGDAFEALIVVLGDNEIRHQMTCASCMSLSTSSSTEPSFLPPWRFCGSLTCRMVRRGAISTPSASGVAWSIVFFFAFMMLGSEA